MKRRNNAMMNYAKRGAALLLALGFACLVLLVSGTYNPFIYFRF